jgi:hypothetical protein
MSFPAGELESEEHFQNTCCITHITFCVIKTMGVADFNLKSIALNPVRPDKAKLKEKSVLKI